MKKLKSALKNYPILKYHQENKQKINYSFNGRKFIEETVGNLRKEVEFYLRKFESLLDNQDKNDISLVAKEIKEKFEAISNMYKMLLIFYYINENS